MEDVKAILDDDELYEEAALESFPLYNKSQMISLELPDRTGDVCFSRLVILQFFIFFWSNRLSYVYSC